MSLDMPRCRCCKQPLERGPSLCSEFADGAKLASADFGGWYFPARCPHACSREGKQTSLDAGMVEVVEGS
jgi:hypothetical protein